MNCLNYYGTLQTIFRNNLEHLLSHNGELSCILAQYGVECLSAYLHVHYLLPLSRAREHEEGDS